MCQNSKINKIYLLIKVEQIWILKVQLGPLIHTPTMLYHVWCGHRSKIGLKKQVNRELKLCEFQALNLRAKRVCLYAGISLLNFIRYLLHNNHT
jgi:hypothetical protein